ncbi:MAG: GTPase Era [Omnitrophica WOR_2 bacterium GWF2_43_52]|nr:MAG: GTPase Era [Omnitrophica WOR_2 bacterium GWC2_44_8]OGX21606.1 MAG: GTPase Era [Omnitrophica WOR_2 bacterium GWF2_43_52]OGX59114.1 MAG: GTPase Era [Omnitrophica WOR_2 bacterium RIFOXYC2_FULL_43_9]HAH20328.1 GTPase Era [Candidatus Omnitrophota bacterium]HBG63864.1 GTPase Era [Candidatus Omnitrophota bacterium]
MDEKRCGMVSIVGRTNTGKSTLLNYILKQKVAIVSCVPQTTRNIVRGILNEKRGQIIFMDTPGIHKPRHRLGKYMNSMAEDSARGADAIVHLVDSSERVGEEERLVVRELCRYKPPVVVAFNKIDLGGKFIPEYIRLWEECKGRPITELAGTLTIVPVSALTGTNIDQLLEVLFSYLPEGPLLYPEDIISDFPERLLFADIVREKLFSCMRQEVPHSIAVLVEDVVERSDKLTYIRAVIFVERDSQKGIVIGDKGKTLKDTGSLARQDMEKQLEKKVYLELTVKVKENWKQDEQLLRQMGIIM